MATGSAANPAADLSKLPEQGLQVRCHYLTASIETVTFVALILFSCFCVCLLTQPFADRLADIKTKAMLGGGIDRIRKQHQSGKLTARERYAKR